MGSASNYLELKILDHLFGKGAYSPPTIYVALSTADPGEAGAGMAEPSGNGYARVATAAGDWNVAAAGLTDNANAITFPQASGSWGTITHFALFDANEAGNMLVYGALNASKVIGSGDTPRFAAGDLDLTLD